MTQREETSGDAREPWVRASVVTRQPVDGCQMIRVESVPCPKHEGEHAKRSPRRGQWVHGMIVTRRAAGVNNVPRLAPVGQYARSPEFDLNQKPGVALAGITPLLVLRRAADRMHARPAIHPRSPL